MSTKSNVTEWSSRFKAASFSPGPQETQSSPGRHCTHPRLVWQLVRDPDLSQRGVSKPAWPLFSKQIAFCPEENLSSILQGKDKHPRKKAWSKRAEVSAHQTCRIVRTTQTGPEMGREEVRTRELHEEVTAGSLPDPINTLQVTVIRKQFKVHSLRICWRM